MLDELNLNDPDEYKIYRTIQLDDCLYGANACSRGLCRRPYEQLFNVLFKNRGRSVCGACIPSSCEASQEHSIVPRKTCKCFRDSAGFHYVSQTWKCIPCFKKEVRALRNDDAKVCTICFSRADDLAQEPAVTRLYTICRWCGYDMESS